MMFSVSLLCLLSSIIIIVPSTTMAVGSPACQLGQQGCQEKAKAPNNASLRSSRNKTSFVVAFSSKIADAAGDSPSTSCILKEQIQFIQDYLENPIYYSQQVASSSSNKNLLDSLEDLAEQLSDSNKAREFYSLGGWPLLASLVSPSVHADYDSGSSNTDNELEENILTIRAAATSALGTAVKNVPEFQPWVLDEIQLQDATITTTTTTTPLELVVQALVEVSSAAASPESCSPSTLDSQQELAKEAVRALSSFLSDNHPAQLTFSNNMEYAAHTLGRQAAEWALEAATRLDAAATNTRTSNNVPMSRHAMHMTMLLSSLANDMINDVQNNAPEHNNNNDGNGNEDIVMNVFSTIEWCQAAIQAATLSPSSSDSFQQSVFLPLQETALRAVATLGRNSPVCFAYYRDDASGKAGMADLTRLFNQQIQTTTTTTMSAKRNLRRRTQKQEKDQHHLLLVQEALEAIAASQ